jgi:IS5 family transposase
MSLTEFLTEVFCLVDDILIDLKHDLRESGDPLRSRGPSPTVSDSVVLTCELAGEPVGRDTDKGLFQYFRRHHQNLFPKLDEVPWRLLPGRRRTCGRPGHMLRRRLLRRLWKRHRGEANAVAPHLSITDSFPMPICRLMRSSYCQLFEGEAAFGHNETNDQTMYGFRGHVEIAWPGAVVSTAIAPANEHDTAVAPEVLEGGPRRGDPQDASRTVLGDKAYQSKRLDAELSELVQLEAPSRSEDGKWPRSLVQIRRRIETVISQLCERFNAKRVWARDRWHLTVRWIRKLCSHTMAMLLCYRHGHPPLQFAELID